MRTFNCFTLIVQSHFYPMLIKEEGSIELNIVAKSSIRLRHNMALANCRASMTFLACLSGMHVSLEKIAP